VRVLTKKPDSISAASILRLIADDDEDERVDDRRSKIGSSNELRRSFPDGARATAVADRIQHEDEEDQRRRARA
jgi:hypothetical protein